MYNFEYVNKKDWFPVKKNIEQILHEVQDLVRSKFTFSYTFIGSSSRNMVTCDFDSNRGFDFDLNMYINDDDNQYTAEKQKHIIMDAINRIAWRYGYSPCEDSTRVITMKVKDKPFSKIVHSCDIAIVNDYFDKKGKKRQEYIHFNKRQQKYEWREQPEGYHLEKKISWLKKQSLWNDVRNVYLYKKNMNTNPDKHSRSLFAETVNEVYQRKGYID